MKKQVINGLKIIVIGLVLSAGISYSASWVAPAGNPPGNNAEGPINVGTTAQTKNGGLGVNSFIAWDNALFAKDLRVQNPFGPNGDVYVTKLANSTNSHICADAQGKLVLCAGGGTIDPPDPGVDPQCSDGIDNDGDGYIDYPADPGCSSATDNSESKTIMVSYTRSGGTGAQTISGVPGYQTLCPGCFPNNNTFIAPPGVSLVTVILAGGGGGGASAAFQEPYLSGGNEYGTTFACVFPTCLRKGGGGGGGGGGLTSTTVTVIPGQSYTISAGVGGARGLYVASSSSGNHGGDGGSSSVVGSPSINLSVTGGRGGRYPFSVSNQTQNPYGFGGAKGTGQSTTSQNGSDGQVYIVRSSSNNTYIWGNGLLGGAGGVSGNQFGTGGKGGNYPTSGLCVSASCSGENGASGLVQLQFQH